LSFASYGAVFRASFVLAEVNMKTFLLLIILLFSLSGCVVGTVVGTAADVAIEVVKVPFKVGGAVVDTVSGDDEEKKEEKD
jgi:ABC-type methionine transport system permease subunit